MKIEICNSCGHIFDRKTDVIYSICEITKHIPNSSYSRLVITKGNESENTNEITESWVNYLDLDFCESCMEISHIKQFLNID